MMDKKRIHEEGLLEKYLLDELSENDRIFVEKAIADDVDLKQQFIQLEADFEKMAFENAIVPDPRVKTMLQKRLEEPKKLIYYRTPLMIAAGLALLFMLTTFLMYNRWQESQERLNLLQTQTNSLQERLVVLEENYQTTNERLQLINAPSTVPFLLKGQVLDQDARAVAYVNHQNKLVVVNPKGLPQLPEDQTYQMWGDVDGEMISMGLLPTDKDLVMLKYIDKAESLNITIEPAGGNDHPTVEKLVSYVTM
ncbi:anti-sigma factor [Flagellimonas lutaonensis]|uniref:Anti-sigma K factor RskA C-terminal domain-containing protein n=1 Tax=Flagellimonas lutaonensis TaxID=516051 RepID=A0A0D5YVH7_9FLAO|nr:anti-sigma factor [Allomuricauda lutaonensis]AKA35906.1 hypothetical protein VC82_2317 [Allomuricauda lutaonensis]